MSYHDTRTKGNPRREENAPRERRRSLIDFRDAHGRTRYRIGSTPPPPLKGRQKWWTLDVGTSETKAKNTLASWQEKSRENPREYFPELFEGTHAQNGESLSDWFARWFDDRDAHGIQTKVDRGRVSNHVPELVLAKPAAGVTAADLESIVETLDRKVAEV